MTNLAELKLRVKILREFGYKKQPRYPEYIKFYERDGLHMCQCVPNTMIIYTRTLTPILADLDFKNREKLRNAVRP